MEVLGNRFGIRKPNPPPFLVKTYLLVEEPSTDAVISWNANGTAFVVWQPAEFARDLLPTLFKHSNFSSFIRQLNTYGFRKVATSRWEFCNDMFKKGKRELLCHICRRKAWAHRPHPKADESEAAAAATSEVETDRRSSSSTSSSEHMSSLSDENKRLRWENGMLSSELSSMKNKCNELLDLVAFYTRSGPVMMIGHGPHGDGCVKEEKEDDDKRMKLFGVRLDLSNQASD